MERILVSFEDDVVADLTRRAKDQDVSRAEIVRRMVRFAQSANGPLVVTYSMGGAKEARDG